MIRARRSSAGFTLIEAIMAMVITGILSGIVAVFIAKPVEGYVDSARRAELTDAADVALRRMTRDIRLALPNSLRVSPGATNYIEFIMTSAGGRYRDNADGSTCGNFLFQTDVNCPPANTQTASERDFDVLGTMPINPAIEVNDFIAVYNLGSGYEPANAYNYDAAADACRVGGCNIAKINSIAGNVITLTGNPFTSQSPPLPSPDSRFQVVPGGVRAVTYACPSGAAGSFTRYQNYGFNAGQPTPPVGGSSATLATGASCTVEYTANATGRNGVLVVQLTLTAGGESVSLFQQIHVNNAP